VVTALFKQNRLAPLPCGYAHVIRMFMLVLHSWKP